MSLMELIQDALFTLWRQKLRSALTVGGVVVAIGALVTLLAFASGMNKNVTDEVKKFNLLQTMTVSAFPGDSSGVLDSAALEWLSELPGVLQVIPESPFRVQAIFHGDTTSVEAQAMPTNARDSFLFSQMKVGTLFADGDTDHVVVTNKLLDEFNIEEADSILGQPLELISVHSHPDSGYAAVAETLQEEAVSILPQMMRMWQRENPDSLIGQIIGNAASAFLEGYMSRVDTVRDTLVICGVMDVGEGWMGHLRPVVLPVASANRLDPGGFTRDPFTLFSSLQSGELFTMMEDSSRQADRVTLELTVNANHEALADSVHAHGFETDDFQESFAEFRKMLGLFTVGMSLLGFIALFIAALGIVNTMVMSILERRREIGVLKSLGAEDRDIRILFLVESATIGLVGSLLGLLLGWIVSETISFAMQIYLETQGVNDVDMFHIGPGTILLAIGFGVIVSMLAGLYPASRAAKLDTVVALREE